MGLFFNDPLPVIVISQGYSAATGENILIARPDSPQLRIFSFSLPDPVILRPLGTTEISAPRLTAIFFAATESLQSDGLIIVLCPFVSIAAAIARWVMLLEDGALIVPFNSEGTIIVSIELSVFIRGVIYYSVIHDLHLPVD